MSSSAEIHVGSLFIPAGRGHIPLAEGMDRVLHTAGDRPDVDTLPALADPAADHRDQSVARRRGDVEEKQARVAALLDAEGLDGLLLARADSVAWFTSGGDLVQDLGSEMGSVALYLSRSSRAVLTDNVQSARVFEEELAGLGFQLKERPWHDHPGRVVDELCRNRRVASDLHARGSHDAEAIRALRWPLTRLERQRLRELGRTLALAVEATCRNFDRGENEADVAGHLAHRLLREGVVPVDLRVAGDDRLARYRRPTFKAAPILKRATITVSGRRHGLCASLSRTVSFGRPEADFRAKHHVAAMVDATCIYFSRPGESVAEVFRRARRIYEKYGHPHEWTLDYQGFVVGYSPREALLSPEGARALRSGMPLSWSPGVGPARSQCTAVIDERGFEVVTAPQDWPRLDVSVKGFSISRPGVLER